VSKVIVGMDPHKNPAYRPTLSFLTLNTATALGVHADVTVWCDCSFQDAIALRADAD
jgi:hypothetical protein